MCLPHGLSRGAIIDNKDGVRRETREAVGNKGKASKLLLLGTKDGEIPTKGIVESEITKEQYYARTKGKYCHPWRMGVLFHEILS